MLLLRLNCRPSLKVRTWQHGLSHVLKDQSLIVQIVACLASPSTKLRTQSADVLAALCMQSQEGHRAVLLSISDFRSTPDERYRFQYLLDSIRPSDDGQDAASEETGIWEYRTAVMSLINALTNASDDLEERIHLREEFGRRGLNEVMTMNRYCDPPDNLLNQFEVYLDERQEDYQDHKERTMGRSQGATSCVHTPFNA